MDRLKVLIVEDDAIVAEDLFYYLEELGHQPLGPAYSSEDAKDLAQENQPHIAMLDIHLSDTDSGIDLGAWFRENMPIPIIFLTAYADENTLAQAKKVHPEHYLLKPFNKLQLKVAVEIAGNNYYNPNTEQRKIQKLYKFSNQLTEPLSNREIDVLQLLEEGYPNRQIAAALFVSEHTVKSHLKNIFSKTDSQSRADLISKLNRL